MPIVNLNANFIKHHLQCPPGKSSIEYCAKDLPGFLVEVSAVSPGVGSYRLRYKERHPATGKPQTRYKSIGRSYEIDFVDAKQRAKELKSMLALGQDIKSSDKDGGKESISYSDFFELYYKPNILQRKRSARADIGKFNTRVKKEFGAMNICEIQVHHIRSFIIRLRQEKLAFATCDRYLAMLSASLGLAKEFKFVTRNAARSIKPFNVDNQVENYLSEEEMIRLMRVLKADKNRVVCSLMLFLLATGARLNEAQMVKWDDVDLNNRVWRIPATNSKSKRVRSVPLNDMAIEALKENQSDDGYVFRSPRGDGKR
jgi:integrase